MDSYKTLKIEPNLGIGPFVVGMAEQELFKVIPVNTPKRKFSGRYTVEVETITLWVDLACKQVTQVGVSKGHTGSLFGAVKIGTSLEEAESLLGSLVINDDYQLIVPGLPGISFNLNPVLNEFTPTPTEGAVIDGIYVY